MQELSRSDRDATTVARRGVIVARLLTILNMICVCKLAAVFLGIAENDLGHQLESLEQLFAPAKKVNYSKNITFYSDYYVFYL
jgi:hypothetical protein